MEGQISTKEMCNEGNPIPNTSTSYDQNDSTVSTPVEETKPQLVLQSPAGGDPLTFAYSTPNTEFVDILKLAFEEFDGLRTLVTNAIDHLCLDDLYNASYETLSNVSKVFNNGARSIFQIERGFTKLGSSNSDLPSPKFLQRIIAHCYNKAVENERALNKHYEPFSSMTYGETSFERMQMIIDEIKPTAQDVFVDLGSGVGQIVAHMAGGSRVKKVFGIEISDLPAKFAARLEEEYRKLMRFYGKKMRQFSLERGDFLDQKYRELITKEATIIFINNYAFQPDLESKIKYELLFELQSGTKIISTKPYASLKAPLNDRQINDLGSIMDVTELKHCPNPCSWTSNNVPYYLHVVDHGKIEKYVTSKKPASLRASDSRRSSTPSSSKNSNSRESSVGYRDASGRNAAYGATTRKSWKLQVSKHNPSVENSEPSSLSRAFSSDSEDSEPERKRKRKNKQNKERSAKPRKPKAAGKDLDLVDGGTKLSEDAKDGIELMHQMTQAVSAGQPVDSTKTAMLVDLATNEEATTKRRTTINGCKQTDAMFPLTDAFPANKRKKRASTQNPTTNDVLNSASKYAHLDVFLTELRRTYEAFLDNIHTPPNGNQGMNEKIDKKIKNEPENMNGTQPTHLNINSATFDNLLQMVDRINQKQNELAQDIDTLRRTIVSLRTAGLTNHNMQQQDPTSSTSNHPPVNGVHHPTQPGTNANNLSELTPQNDGTAKYATLVQNGNATNSVNNVLKSYINILSANCQPSLPASSAASIVSALAELQNAQHLSPQQQAHPVGQYGSQLQLNGINGTALNANTLNHTSVLQWTSGIMPQLNAFLSSNEYSNATKQQVINDVASQNPAFYSLLQLINDPTLPTQIRANANSLGFASPTSTAQSVGFSQLTSNETTTSNSNGNHLLATQKPLVYTSKAENQTGQLSQNYVPSNDLNNDESKTDRKKTERKPRSNVKKSKEINGVSSGSNEASGSTNSAYLNQFNAQNNHTIPPIGVEKILSQQLSIQQSLSLPKESPAFHSPSF